jgi:hypothetical protein
LYGPTSFMIANFIIGIPYLVLNTILFVAISNWLGNFNPTATSFFTWVLWFSLDLLVTHSLMIVSMPTELASMVVHQLVSSDICGAWKLRGISKIFKDAIEDHIVLRQPSEVVRNSGKIIKQLVPRYLYCRIKKPNDVHTTVLVRITKMNDYLCEELNTT